jgi:hypothetical protein
MTKNKKKKGFVNGNKEVGLGDRVQEAGCSWEEAINRLRSCLIKQRKRLASLVPVVGETGCWK